jgi:hypothetical protein
MFNYIYSWWYYNADIEEEKVFEKQETNEQKYKVLEEVKIFDKETLKTHIQECKKKNKKKRRKRKRIL